MAPMKCDSSLKFTEKPRASFSTWIMPTLRATPPVNVSSRSIPTRRSRPIEREAIDWWTPSKMSSTFLPFPSQDSTSDSAKTGQVGLRRPAREGARPGGALVVHAEVDDIAARADADGLGVLAAHVEHGSCLREDMDRASSVTGDFRHLGVAEGDAVAAVAG